MQIPSGDDPEERAARNEVTEVVREAIAGLPPAFRFPLLLKDLLDFSIREIAEVLHIKEATVKTRLHRARLRLAEDLYESVDTEPSKFHARLLIEYDPDNTAARELMAKITGNTVVRNYADAAKKVNEEVARNQGSLGVLGTMATWSPDSNWIAFEHRDPRTLYDSIALFEVATATTTILTDGFAAAGQPAFSPDGLKVAFTARRGARTNVYTMNAADGSGQTRLTDETLLDEQDEQPAWQPVPPACYHRPCTQGGSFEVVSTFSSTGTIYYTRALL